MALMQGTTLESVQQWAEKFGIIVKECIFAGWKYTVQDKNDTALYAVDLNQAVQFVYSIIGQRHEKEELVGKPANLLLTYTNLASHVHIIDGLEELKRTITTSFNTDPGLQAWADKKKMELYDALIGDINRKIDFLKEAMERKFQMTFAQQ